MKTSFPEVLNSQVLQYAKWLIIIHKLISNNTNNPCHQSTLKQTLANGFNGLKMQTMLSITDFVKTINIRNF